MNYLPTDNLYKFCAIAGLIIVGFSVYYPFALNRTLSADVIDLSTEMGVLEAESEFTHDRAKKLHELKQDFIERQQSRYKPNPAQFRLTYSEQEIKSIEDEIDRLNRDIRAGNAKMKGLLQKTKHLLVEVETINRLAYVSLAVGLILTFYGFFSWYRLVQKPLDEKLKEPGSKEGTHPDAAGNG